MAAEEVTASKAEAFLPLVGSSAMVVGGAAMDTNSLLLRVRGWTRTTSEEEEVATTKLGTLPVPCRVVEATEVVRGGVATRARVHLPSLRVCLRPRVAVMAEATRLGRCLVAAATPLRVLRLRAPTASRLGAYQPALVPSPPMWGMAMTKWAVDTRN